MDVAGGYIAQMMATAQTTARKGGEEHTTMRIFGGLSAANERPRPAWAAALQKHVTPTCVYGYEALSSFGNFTAWSMEYVQNILVTDLRVPGAWCLQCVAATMPELLTFTRTLMKAALLEDGWTIARSDTMFSKKLAQAPARGSWPEMLQIAV